MSALPTDWKAYTGDKLLTLPSTRAMAKKLGSRLYFTVKCKHGHDCPRVYSSKTCAMCVIAARGKVKARAKRAAAKLNQPQPFVMAFGMKLRIWQ